MKHLTKKLSVLFLLLLLTMLPVMSASAAAKVPGKVQSLKAKKVSETSVQLSWSKASNASGYQIYQVNPETGALKKIAKTTKRSHTLKKMKLDQTYVYQVCAYRKSGKKTVMSETLSPKVSVTPKMYKPAKVSGLKVSGYGNTTISLKWNKAKNASGYYIYLYDEETKEFKKLAAAKSASYTTGKLEEGKEYTFLVRSYRTVQGKTALGEAPNPVTATAKGFSSAAKKVHGRYFNATLRRNSTGTIVGTKTKKTLKQGLKVTSTSRSSNTVTVILKDGTQVRVKGSDLRYNSLKTVRTDFTRQQKEAYINEKGYSSPTGYLIWISQYTTNVNIFKGSRGNWKLVRTMPCVVGKDGKTPTGTFRLGVHRGWNYGGPQIYFSWNPKKEWGNSFHLRVDGHTTGAYSHGCIRLSNADLNYLNSNCKNGTTVVSY